MYNFDHDDICFIADIRGSLFLFPEYYVLYLLMQCTSYVYDETGDVFSYVFVITGLTRR